MELRVARMDHESYNANILTFARNALINHRFLLNVGTGVRSAT
jgi:hypothetical protein